MQTDTIIALSTPPGVGALAVVRLSGPGSGAVVQSLLAETITWEAGRVVYRTLRQNGVVLDDVVLTFWQAPRSFTGEDMVEISCHGNPKIVDSIVRAALELGARAARPGEFTQRAFLNDRLSLTQAEGLLDLLYAPTTRALASARAMKEGKLGQALESSRRELIDLLSHLEASLDFAEEGIEPRVGPEFAARVEKLAAELTSLLKTAPLGLLLHEGALVALVGEPNVGKSSLLNALLREDRAIVAPTPGTTRDLIEATCNVRGLPLRLVDTAGRRDSTDPVEMEGTRRARALLPQARLLLHVVAADQPFVTSSFELPDDVPCLLVANKSDLGLHPSLSPEAIAICALTGEGLDLLESQIESILCGKSGEAEAELAINARQEAALHRAVTALEQARKNLAADLGLELVSIDLRTALEELAEVIGETTTEDILTRLFQNFCIGK